MEKYIKPFFYYLGENSTEKPKNSGSPVPKIPNMTVLAADLLRLGIRLHAYPVQVRYRLLKAAAQHELETPLTAQLVASNYIQDCSCCADLEAPKAVAAAVHIWLHMTIPFDCHCLLGVYHYLILEQRCPSDAEFNRFCDHVNRLAADPEQYYTTERVVISTRNLEHLTATTCQQSDKQCGICLMDIALDSPVYSLPPCQHLYHADQQDCLGDKGIKNWLATSVHCPLCQQEVHIPRRAKRRRL